MTEGWEALGRWPPAARWGAVVVAAVVPLAVAAGPWTVGAADAALAGVAALLGAAGVAAVRSIDRVADLPLQLSARALTGRVNGCPVVRFRLRLGLGRPMAGARATIRFRPDDGPDVEVGVVEALAPVVLGPWTIVVADLPGRGNGSFLVRAEARGGDRLWVAEGQYPGSALGRGWFCGGIVRRGGGIRIDPATWEQGVEEGA